MPCSKYFSSVFPKMIFYWFHCKFWCSPIKFSLVIQILLFFSVKKKRNHVIIQFVLHQKTQNYPKTNICVVYIHFIKRTQLYILFMKNEKSRLTFQLLLSFEAFAWFFNFFLFCCNFVSLNQTISSSMYNNSVLNF